MKLSVIIPAYNEINTIGEILSRVLEVDLPRVISLEYFNRIGILGWFLNGKILRKKRLSSLQLRIYNLLVPLFKLESFFPLPFGTSLLAVGEKSK